jgi:hypothetical protein
MHEPSLTEDEWTLLRLLARGCDIYDIPERELAVAQDGARIHRYFELPIVKRLRDRGYIDDHDITNRGRIALLPAS